MARRVENQKTATPLSELARCFSQGVLTELSRGRRNPTLSQLLHDHPLVGGDASLGQWFDAAFDSLQRDYRCEYVYKNAIALRMVMGRHSPMTSAFLSEVRVGPHVADAVVLNGTSIAYEVKSEYDSFLRLADQLSAYQRMFDQVYVVCPSKAVEKTLQEVPSPVGVMSLTRGMNLSVARKAKRNAHHVEPEFLFSTFRKSEYVGAAARIEGVPDVPNGRLYQACKDVFVTLPAEQAHDEMVRQLKERGPRLRRSQLSWLPRSLTATFLATPISTAGISRLKEVLSGAVGGHGRGKEGDLLPVFSGKEVRPCGGDR